MPAARLAVLKALVKENGQTTSHISQASGLHWNVVYRHLEDMTAVGVVDDLSQFDERDHRWRLRGEEGDLIRKVVGG